MTPEERELLRGLADATRLACENLGLTETAAKIRAMLRVASVADDEAAAKADFADAVAHLADAGINAEVRHTGGNVYLLHIEVGGGAFIWITRDEGEPGYLVGGYRGPSSDGIYSSGIPLARLAEEVFRMTDRMAKVIVNEDVNDLIEEAYQTMVEILALGDYLDDKGYTKEMNRLQRSAEQLRRWLYTPNDQRVNVYDR